MERWCGMEGLLPTCLSGLLLLLPVVTGLTGYHFLDNQSDKAQSDRLIVWIF